MTPLDLPDDYRGLIAREGGNDFKFIYLPSSMEDPGTFRTRKLAEGWLARNFARFETAGVKMRACMCCRTQFFSQGSHNRMCQPCRRTADV